MTSPLLLKTPQIIIVAVDFVSMTVGTSLVSMNNYHSSVDLLVLIKVFSHQRNTKVFKALDVSDCSTNALHRSFMNRLLCITLDLYGSSSCTIHPIKCPETLSFFAKELTGFLGLSLLVLSTFHTN